MKDGQGGGAAVLEIDEVPGKNGIHTPEKPAKGRKAATPASASGGEAQRKRISMKLVGVSALLLDPMSAKTLEILRTKAKNQIDTNRSKEDIAGEKLYRDDAGNLVMPTTNLMAALNHAGKLIKLDAKRSLATGDSSWICGLLGFDDEYCPLLVNGEPATDEHWVADERRGVLETGKTAVAIVRPKFKVWEIPVTAIFDPTDLPFTPTEEMMLQLFKLAGRFSGLGSFRPSCKGSFGKFDVADWVAVPLDA